MFPDGAAGLVSTADDLLAFARMLLRGGDPVLTAGQVRQMSSDHLTGGQRKAGLGVHGHTSAVIPSACNVSSRRQASMASSSPWISRMKRLPPLKWYPRVSEGAGQP